MSDYDSGRVVRYKYYLKKVLPIPENLEGMYRQQAKKPEYSLFFSTYLFEELTCDKARNQADVDVQPIRSKENKKASIKRLFKEFVLAPYDVERIPRILDSSWTREKLISLRCELQLISGYFPSILHRSLLYLWREEVLFGTDDWFEEHWFEREEAEEGVNVILRRAENFF